MTSAKLIGIASFLLLAVSFAQSQPPPQESKPVLAYNLGKLLPYLDDREFQTELKLTDAQTRQLLALRQKEWDYAYKTAPGEVSKNRAERDKTAAAAIKDILKPEQLTRAEQLALQLDWFIPSISHNFWVTASSSTDLTRVNGHTLVFHPGLAAILNFSEDQKKVATLTSLPTLPNTILLTAEQTETLRKLLGTIRTAAWTTAEDPRMRDMTLFVYSDRFTTLGIAAKYHIDLKITPEQIKALGAPQSSIGIRNKGNISPAETQTRIQAEDAESEKAVTKVLTADQMTRIRQIIVRMKHDPALGHTEPLIVNLADELKATPEQRKTFTALRAAHAKIIDSAITLNDFDSAYKAIRTANANLEKGLTEALTDDQRAKLKTLAGDPVAGVLKFPPTVLTEQGIKQREISSGYYTDELRWLNGNKTMQAELNFTTDQIDLARKWYSLFNRQFNAAPQPKNKDDQAEKTKFIKGALASILDPQQTKRFREIMIQHRGRPVGWYTSFLNTALTYPGVAEELKLTAEQKKQIAYGEHPLDVLTDVQRKALRELRGARFMGDYSLYTAAPRPVSPESDFNEQAAFLLAMPWDELNLKPEQRTKLAVAMNRYHIDGPFGKNPAQAKKAGGVASDFKAELKRIFGKEELPARVAQLLLQARAAVSLRKTLERAEVVKALQLTPVQLGTIADIEEEATEIADLLLRSPFTFNAHLALQKQLRDRVDARILVVLTPEQLTKWKEMIGKPYDGFKKNSLRQPMSQPNT